MDPTQQRERIAQEIVDLVEASVPGACEARETLLAQARALVATAEPNTVPPQEPPPLQPNSHALIAETSAHEDISETVSLQPEGQDTITSALAPQEASPLPDSHALMAESPASEDISEAVSLQPEPPDTVPSELTPLEALPLQPDSHALTAESPAPDDMSESVSLQPEPPDTVPSELTPQEPSPLQPEAHALTAESPALNDMSEMMVPQPEAPDTVTSELPPQEPSPLQIDSHALTAKCPVPEDISETVSLQPEVQDTVVAPLRPGEIPAITLPVVPVPARPPRVEIMTNARAGAPYRSRVIAHAEEGPAYVVDCEIPVEAMVSFQDGQLCGETPRAGEYDIQVSVAVGTSDPPRIVRTEARLVVNPDPRSLWKSIPSDRDVPGWKPDSAHTLLEGAGSRRLVVASQRGRSHGHVGAPRDDDFAAQVSAADGWNILAVADGAGSAKRSRIGSRVACETAVEVAAAKLAETAAQWPLDRLATPLPGELDRQLRHLAYRVLGTAVFEAVKAIEARGTAQGYAPRDYATTLLLALHRPLHSGDLIVTIWVGDGAIGLLEADGASRLLGAPDGGGYAGQTRFLDREVVTDGEQIMRRIQVAVVPHLEALILMSDGVSDPMFPSDAALHETTCWRALWSELYPLFAQTHASQHLLEWLDFWSSGNHDDRTVAVLF